jgi:beta-lactamase class A
MKGKDRFRRCCQSKERQVFGRKLARCLISLAVEAPIAQGAAHRARGGRMNVAVTRRAAMLGAASLTTLGPPASTAIARLAPPAAADQIRAIEAKNGGRLGVLIVDATGAAIENRADERFPLTSTFKFLAATAVLKLVDAGEQQLDRIIPYTEADVEPIYSPVTKNHIGVGMSIVDLCAAAVVLSDNNAGNLLLRILGGPEGLTRFCRSLDDQVTRLDRTEPTLNSAIPGDDRDTTSPRVMVANMRRILLGNTLSAASRRRLETWLIDDKVGGNRLRAGIPSTWRIGDKTGSGENGTANTIGILWPPGSSPILAAVYYTGSTEPRDRMNAVHAQIGRLVADTFGT